MAQTPGQSVDAVLSSGETLRGVLVSDDGTTLVMNHPVLGTLSIPRASVTGVSITPPPPTPESAGAPVPPPAAPAAPAPAVAEAKAPEVKKDPESFWKGWTGSVELGLNGADGNSQLLSFRGAVNGKRETSKMVTTAGVQYIYTTSDGDKTADRGEANIRNDWKLGDSRWRFFVAGKGEMDQFQPWDYRVTAIAGFGYELIKTDSTLFLPRFGLAATKEFGSDDQRIRPELNLGFDFEHKLDERQKLFANFDYFLNLLSIPDYRTLAKVGYEVVVDPKNNLSLKLGVEHQYQSPNPGRKKSDLTYFALLVFNW